VIVLTESEFLGESSLTSRIVASDGGVGACL